MNVERRRAKRFRVNLPVQWEGEGKSEHGTISDLSMTGCFMLTAGVVARDEFVSLTMELPNRKTILLGGEVVYHTEEIGFAVRFTTGATADKRKLAAFLKQRQAEEGDA